MEKLERRGQMMIHEHTGGFFVNIDSAGNLVHRDSCSETRKMDPEKVEGEILHFGDYDSAVSHLKERNIGFKTCDKCRPQ